MTIRFALALLACAWTTAASAQTPATAADFSGTWNIEVMSHQIALVIEPKDATHVTATMMMMGRDVALRGELKDRTLTLVGDRSGDPAAGATPAHGAAAAAGDGGAQAPAPRPITVTLQADGTISGSMMTSQGPATWTGERLKKRK
jgi:hypothetical protein